MKIFELLDSRLAKSIIAFAMALMFMLVTPVMAAQGKNPKDAEIVKVIRQGIEPSAEEQLFIYLLNKARHNPPAYGKSIGLDLDKVEPRPPLAVNKELTSSARFRAEDLSARNYFSHVDPDGIGPNWHALESGYALGRQYARDKKANNIESLQAGCRQAGDILSNLVIDRGVSSLGHRKHLLSMDDFYAQAREVGVGCFVPADGISGDKKARHYNGYFAAHTARTDSTDVFVTGVVYDDKNGNGLYDSGEGLGGVTVNCGVQSTTSMEQGGFSLPVKAGPIITGCQKGAFKGQAKAQVIMDKSNVHIEFISGRSDGIINFEKSSGKPGGK